MPTLPYTDACRRDFLRPLDHPHVVFDGAARDRLKYQLDCPFHPQRLTLPTTLHTLPRTLPTIERFAAHQATAPQLPTPLYVAQPEPPSEPESASDRVHSSPPVPSISLNSKHDLVSLLMGGPMTFLKSVYRSSKQKFCCDVCTCVSERIRVTTLLVWSRPP